MMFEQSKTRYGTRWHVGGITKKITIEKITKTPLFYFKKWRTSGNGI